MASFHCYDSSDVIATLIMTNFPLYLIQLWCQFFPNACLWRRSLCSNLAGIDSEKLYRATFICQYGLFCCMALVSFRLFCKNLGNLQEFFGQMDYRPPPAKNCPYAYGEREPHPPRRRHKGLAKTDNNRPRYSLNNSLRDRGQPGLVHSRLI